VIAVAHRGRKPEDWDREWPPGWTVEHVAETGSTNTDLLESADRRPDRSVLVADHQTAGRGRLDRRWDAPPGANLLVSILFHDVPADPGELVRRIGLAAVDACRTIAPEAGRVSLKWPNDVLIDDAKLAGVLAQRSGDGAVVVGLGLNVEWGPVGGAKLGRDVERPGLLAAMLAAYDDLPISPDNLIGRYRAELSTLGRRVDVQMPAGDIVGIASDITSVGQLVVRTDEGAERIVDVADVTHVRPAD